MGIKDCRVFLGPLACQGQKQKEDCPVNKVSRAQVEFQELRAQVVQLGLQVYQDQREN